MDILNRKSCHSRYPQTIFCLGPFSLTHYSHGSQRMYGFRKRLPFQLLVFDWGVWAFVWVKPRIMDTFPIWKQGKPPQP